MTSTAALGEIAEFVNGLAFKPDDWGPSGRPIIRIQNLTDPTRPFNRTERPVPERYIVGTGDLLVSWSATLGVFVWSGPDGAVLNQHIFRVLPNECRVDKRYLRHALARALVDMSQHLHGATMQHVNRGEFLGTRLRLPSIPEQRRIADILDKADAIRRKRKEAIALTEELLRSAFLEMFGDPVTNPKGWEVKPLGELIDEERGISYGVVQRGPEAAEGVPVVRISNFVTNRFDGGDVVHTSKAISDGFRRTILRGGELVVSIRGTVGRVATVPHSARGWNVSREVAVIPLLSDVSGPFVQRALLSDSLQRFMLGNVKGVAQSGINLSDLRQAPVPRPSPTLVARWETFAQGVEGLERRLTEGSRVASVLFDSLTCGAFS